VGALSVHGVCGAWGLLSVGLFANGSYGGGWGGVHKLFKDGQWTRLVNDGSKAVIDQYTTMIGTDPKAGGWSDVGVTGIFGGLFGAPGGGDMSQFCAQVVDVLTCAVFVFCFAFAWFKFSNLIFPIRSKRADELEGLDVPEMGVEAYPDFTQSDKSSPPVG
jgi:ammonium transporter, Amt family